MTVEKIYYQEYFYVTMPSFPEVGWSDFRNVLIGEGRNSECFKQSLYDDPDGLLISHDIYIDRKAKVPAGTFEIHIVKTERAAKKAVAGMKPYEYRWRRDRLRHKYAYGSFEKMNSTSEWRAMKIWEQMKWIEENIEKQYPLADAEWETTRKDYIDIGLKYPVKHNGEWVYE